MATLRQQLSDLIDKLSPDMERAFRSAIEDIKSEIVLKEVVAYLERRDIEGAIKALHIDPAALQDFQGWDGETPVGRIRLEDAGPMQGKWQWSGHGSKRGDQRATSAASGLRRDRWGSLAHGRGMNDY